MALEAGEQLLLTADGRVLYDDSVVLADEW
jgi:hypothetical protein